MLNPQILKYSVIISFLFSIVVLSYLILKTFSFGKKVFYSQKRGEPIKGIIYSLGKGMLPWEKESVSKNITTYFLGIFYHLAIFASFVFLFFKIFNFDIPPTQRTLIKIILLSGFFSGIGLFSRRILTSYLRKISIADDFVANFLVDLFLLFSILSVFNPFFIPYLYIYSTFLFLYIPSGKIRHCFFFFYSKIISGIFWGWRGVFGKNPFRETEMENE